MNNFRGGKSNKTVVVLGMHRSGNSRTAGMLQILGVDIGKDLIEGDLAFNINGYFEDKAFLKMNEEILRKAGGTSHDPPVDVSNLANDISIVNKIKNLVSKNISLWGWRDPRTSLTVELYLPYLVNPHFIICIRNIYENAKSVSEMEGYDIMKCLRLTQTYNDRIIAFLEKNPRLPKLFVSFEDVTNDPIAVGRDMCDFLDIEFTEEKKVRIRSFILPEREIQEQRVRIQREREMALQYELLNKEKQLQDIYNSRGWKIISILHRIRKSVPILKRL